MVSDSGVPEPPNRSLGFLAAPPVVGLGLLASIVFGFASDAMLDSAAATSVALVVAAALILVPPVIYAIAPDAYIQHHRHIKQALAELGAGHRAEPTSDGERPSSSVP